MTNEEIEYKASALLDDLREHLEEFPLGYEDCALCTDIVASAIQNAVAQAYEEAAQTATELVTADVEKWQQTLVATEIADRIRALNDSLALEPTPS
jgi:hypothetical protein